MSAHTLQPHSPSLGQNVLKNTDGQKGLRSIASPKRRALPHPVSATGNSASQYRIDIVHFQQHTDMSPASTYILLYY